MNTKSATLAFLIISSISLSGCGQDATTSLINNSDIELDSIEDVRLDVGIIRSDMREISKVFDIEKQKNNSIEQKLTTALDSQMQGVRGDIDDMIFRLEAQKESELSDEQVEDFQLQLGKAQEEMIRFNTSIESLRTEIATLRAEFNLQERDKQPIVIKKNKISFKNNFGLSLEYPSELLLKKINKSVEIYKTISYKHSQLCPNELAGDTFKDLSVQLFLYNNGLSEFIESHPDGKNIEREFAFSGVSSLEDVKNIKPITLAGLNGYVQEQGNQGCGYYNYFFALNDGQLLYAKRQMIPFVNASSYEKAKEVLQLNGILTTQKEYNLFVKILEGVKK